MKQLFFLLAILVPILCLACKNTCYNSGIQATVSTFCDNSKDTVVTAKKISERISGEDALEMEYSLYINHSVCSPSISILENGDRLSIQLHSELRELSPNILSDTSAVERHTNANTTVLSLSSTEKMEILRKLLDRASEDFDLSKTRSVFFCLSVFEDEMMEVNKRYTEEYRGKDTEYSGTKMAGIIKETPLYKKLFNLFMRYSIKVKQVYAEDVMCVPFQGQRNTKDKSPSKFAIEAGIIIITGL